MFSASIGFVAKVIHVMHSKRPQGRPPSGSSEVGSQKIVEGMQAALRSLQSGSITRKDIARFAGVTPALVTYYFPEKNTLIDAATVPIAEKLACSVRECLVKDTDPNRTLLNLITALIKCYAYDTSILDLYNHRRSVTDQCEHPNALDDLVTDITAFFTIWLQSYVGCQYQPRFLTRILLGTCKAVARQQGLANELVAYAGADQHVAPSEAMMVYAFFVGALTHTRREPPDAILVDRGDRDVPSLISERLAPGE